MKYALTGRKEAESRVEHDQCDVGKMTESAPVSFRNPSYYMTMNSFATHGIP